MEFEVGMKVKIKDDWRYDKNFDGDGINGIGNECINPFKVYTISFVEDSINNHYIPVRLIGSDFIWPASVLDIVGLPK